MLQKKFQIKHSGNIILLFVLLWVCPKNWASDNYWSFKNITNNDGLSHNYILDIVQDNDGFLWIATIDGLNRFDGSDFKIYQHTHEDSNSISSNILRSLLIDNEGMLWIGTFNKGLCRYNQQYDNFICYPVGKGEIGTNDGKIYDLDVDNDGNIWIATLEGGLNKYNRSSGTFSYYLHDSSNTETIQGNSVLSVHADMNGNIWTGVRFKGVSCFATKENRFYNYLLQDDKFAAGGYIPKIIDNEDDTFWLASELGIIKLKISGNTILSKTNLTPKMNHLHSNVINDFTKLNNNQLIMGYGSNGVYTFNTQTQEFKPIVDIEGFNNNFISFATTITNDGSVWVGTKDKGLFHYQPMCSQFNLVKKLPKPGTLSEHSVLSIFEERNGDLWIGTSDGLNYRNSKIAYNELLGFKHLVFQNDPQDKFGVNIIYAIYKDSHNIMWMGTQSGVIAVNIEELRNSNQLKKTWLNNTAKINPQTVVWSISEDKNGDIWLGTERGLYQLNDRNRNHFPQSFTFHTNIKPDTNTIPSVRIRNTYTDSLGNLWACTYSGISKYTGNNTFKTYLKGLPTRSALIVGNDFYVGTLAQGLYHTDLSKHKTTFNLIAPLKQSTIWSILNDTKNNLWISTNKGIVKFNRTTEKTTRFYKEHGLQNNEFISGSYFKGPSGKLYFGGVNGYNVFYPDSIETLTHKPKTIITGLRIFNKPVLPGDTINKHVVLKHNITVTNSISLNYHHKIVSIEFAAIDFNTPRKIKYLYRLVGLNDNWIELESKNRSVTFTGLKKGDYQFEVKAIAGHGVESDVKTLEITVIPPFWDTIAFYFLVILIVFMLTVFFIEHRERNSKRDKEILQRERDLMQILMDSIPDKIYFKDTSSKFTRVNQALADEVGQSLPEDLIGKTDFDYFPQSFAKQTYTDEQNIIASGIPQINKEEFHEDRFGQFVWYTATKVPVYNNDNKIVGIVGISRDITKQKQHEIQMEHAMQRAEESDKLKSSFLENMSHEVRTPMNAILGFLDVIRNDITYSSKVQSYFQIIELNGHLLLKLVDDIIDISKIEADQIEYEITDFSINHLLKNIFVEYQHKIELDKENNLFNFKLNLATTDDISVSSDINRVNQIIKNLLENAIKFTHTGHVELGALLGNNVAEIFVRDTGIGIPEDRIEEIFGRFTKVESSTQLFRGTGMGLYICKRLSDALDLNLSVESELNKGSVFRIKFPNAKKEIVNLPKKKESTVQTTNITAADWSKLSVLIVEDEISNFNILKIYLKATKINILHASDGKEAIELYKRTPDVNLILMDIKIPKIGGLDVIKHIRAHNKEVPILAQTAFAMKHEKDEIMAAGCNDYIKKPISREHLLNQMGKYLETV